MHPILFRIPLPASPKLWWLLAAVALIVLVYAAFALRRGEKSLGLSLLGGTALLGVLGYVYRGTVLIKENCVDNTGHVLGVAETGSCPDGQLLAAGDLPIYSYGVMLGISLVIGWYLTLRLAENVGLPRETMANCYVITALAAIAGSRILYILTNLNEFHELGDVFALRKGGLVAYGGFLGGFVGSWAYLSVKKIRLMAWADAAVPSLASGILVTRIGCYLYGCDFGKRLEGGENDPLTFAPGHVPSWLANLGTFPKWDIGVDGSPAFLQHMKYADKDPQLKEMLLETRHSLPVHPTQLYESLVGLALLVLLLWYRKRLRFRGELFCIFVFAYGYLRFLLEVVRDDPERGDLGPALQDYLLVPGCLALFGVAFWYGISRMIKSKVARSIAGIGLVVLPALLFYLLLHQPYSRATPHALSTSQAIGLVSALACAGYFAYMWEEAKRRPKLALALGEGAVAPEPEKAKAGDDEDDDDDDDDAERKPLASESEIDETSFETPAAKKTKTKAKAKGKPAEKEATDEEKEDVPEKEAAPAPSAEVVPPPDPEPKPKPAT